MCCSFCSCCSCWWGCPSGNHRCYSVPLAADTSKGCRCAAPLINLLLNCLPWRILPDWADAFGWVPAVGGLEDFLSGAVL